LTLGLNNFSFQPSLFGEFQGKKEPLFRLSKEAMKMVKRAI
jgi:hypothetical protein